MGREQRGSRLVYVISDAGGRYITRHLRDDAQDAWDWTDRMELAHVFTDRSYAVRIAFALGGYIVQLTSTERGN